MANDVPKDTITVFAARFGEKIHVSLNEDGNSTNASITALEALAVAVGLIGNARVSLFGTVEAPKPQLDPIHAVVGTSLDLSAQSLAGLVELLSAQS